MLLMHTCFKASKESQTEESIGTFKTSVSPLLLPANKALWILFQYNLVYQKASVNLVVSSFYFYLL